MRLELGAICCLQIPTESSVTFFYIFYLEVNQPRQHGLRIICNMPYHVYICLAEMHPDTIIAVPKVNHKCILLNYQVFVLKPAVNFRPQDLISC
jgi:hypothetical protein